MEQYMSKTQADYGSRVARPKIEDKDNFELKGQFIKELRTNNFSDSDHGDASEHIEKVFKIVDLFHIYNINIEQVMLRAFPWSLTGVASRWLRNKPSGCEQCKGPNYTKDFPLKEEGKTLEEAYYTQLGAHFQGGRYRATAPGFYQRNNTSPLYQEQRQSMEENLNSNLENEQGTTGKRIGSLLSSTEANLKVKDPGSFTLPSFINNVCFGNALADLGTSVSVMPLLTYLNLGLGELAHTKLTIELADKTVKYPKGSAENVLVGIGKFVFPEDFIILDMPEDIKVPMNLKKPFLSTVHAKIEVKENSKKDKIRSKADKNGKHGKTKKSQKQLQ
nr:hypothetical protein [Tanacetum cinerariifolium]